MPFSSFKERRIIHHSNRRFIWEGIIFMITPPVAERKCTFICLLTVWIAMQLEYYLKNWEYLNFMMLTCLGDNKKSQQVNQNECICLGIFSSANAGLDSSWRMMAKHVQILTNVHLDFPVASNASIHMERTSACVLMDMKYSLIT